MRDIRNVVKEMIEYIPEDKLYIMDQILDSIYDIKYMAPEVIDDRIISQLFPTWQIDQWKRNRKTSVVHDREGGSWALKYLTSDEENDAMGILSWIEHFGVEMVRDEY